MKILKITMPIAMSLVFFGCASKHYEEAIAKDTVSAYNNFLQEYGDSDYASRARYTRNALIAFNKAKNINTIEGYDYFLKQYSSSRYEYRAEKKKNLLLQKSDYNEAIQNEEKESNYYSKLESKSHETSNNNITSALIMFATLLSGNINNSITYDEYIKKWEYKGDSKLNDDIKYRKKEKNIRIKKKYISDLKSKLRNSNSAIEQVHIMTKYAYNDDYWHDMSSNGFLKEFYKNMKDCYATKRDITVIQEKYKSVGGSWLSVDTTYIYAGKIFEGDVVYKNDKYIRTLHNVSDLTNFTTNKNKWIENIIGKDAFGSYSAFKQENKLSDSDLFSNTFPSQMIEKFVPTRYSTKTSSLGGGIGDFISDHPIASIAIGAVAYKALSSSSDSSSSSYSSSSYSSSGSSSSNNNNCDEVKKQCKNNCSSMSNKHARECRSKCSDAYYSCKRGDTKAMRRNICKSQCVTKAGGNVLDLKYSDKVKCFRSCK